MIYEEKHKRGFPARSIQYPWICQDHRPCKLFTTEVHSRPCHTQSDNRFHCFLLLCTVTLTLDNTQSRD
jgi:hypothetical protein